MFARNQGPDAFGHVGVAAGLGYLAMGFVEPGLNPLLVREGALDPHRLSRRFASVLRYKILVGACWWTGLVAAAAASSASPALTVSIAFVTGATLLGAVEDLCCSTLVALGRFGREAVLRLAMRSLTAGAGLVSLWSRAGATQVLATFALGAVLAAALAVAAVAREGIRPWARGTPAVVAWAMRDWPFVVGAGLWFLCGRVDQVLASLLGLGPAEIGHYNAGFKVVEALSALPGAITAAFLPALATRLRTGSGAQVLGATEAALLTSMTVTAPLFAGGAILAAPLLSAVYGWAYTPAAPILIVQFAVLPLWGLELALGQSALASGTPGLYARAMAANLVVHVTCAGALVPTFGAPGAATAALTAHGVGALFLAVGLRRSGLRLMTARWFAAPWLAAGIMAMVVLPLGGRSLAWPVLVGALTYGSAIAVLGVPGRLRPHLRAA
jgi:O-antigen/teichoic acid export membrane protein